MYTELILGMRKEIEYLESIIEELVKRLWQVDREWMQDRVLKTRRKGDRDEEVLLDRRHTKG